MDNLKPSLLQKRNALYPLMIAAAVSVIVLSLTGIAAITGYLPTAHSRLFAGSTPGAADSQTDVSGAPATPAAAIPGAAPTADAHNRNAPQPTACANRGVIESIHTVSVKGQGSGVGAVAGGVSGGVIGNEIGSGNGRTLMTLLGAAGGAFAGNEIEKNVKKTTNYVVSVRMDDGTTRTVTESARPAFAVGDKVRVVHGDLTSIG